MRLGAFDVDYLFAVDFAEGVERGAGSQRHEWHRHDREQYPNTTIGTSATINVKIRLFTPHRLDGPRRSRFSCERDAGCRFLLP